MLSSIFNYNRTAIVTLAFSQATIHTGLDKKRPPHKILLLKEIQVSLSQVFLKSNEVIPAIL